MTDNNNNEPEAKNDDQQQPIEATDKANSDLDETHKAKPSRLKRVFWYIVLVLIIATIAWVVLEKPYQQLDLGLTQETTQQKAEETNSEPDASQQMEERYFRMDEEVTRLSAQVSRLSTALQKAQQDQATEQLTQQLQQVQTTLSQQQQALSQLQRQLPEQQFEQIQRWRLFEAKQTVSAAARLVWGAQDYQAALELLQIADSQVAGIESSEAIKIRQLLAKDIAQLEALADADTDALVLSVAGLQQRINALPNRVSEKQLAAQQSAQTVSDNATDWQTNLAANWDDFLDGFIRIQPTVTDAEPLLSTSQREAIDARLQLLLTMAQHAGLTHQQSLWRSNLDQSIPLIRALKGDSDAVQDVVGRIKKLRQQQLGGQQVKDLASLQALAKAVSEGGLQ